MFARGGRIAFLISGLLAACSTPPPPGLLESQFQRLAFSSEFGGENRIGRLVRWVEPVRVRINGPDFYLYSSHIDTLIDDIAATTGHDIALAAPTQTGNMLIHLTTTAKLAAIAGPGVPCYTRVVIDAHQRLVRAAIFIRSGGRDLVRHCLAEEMIQAMGLLDDSPLIPGSLFHDGFTGPDPTPVDRVVLATLYDRRLRAGMTEHQAMAVLPRILADHKR